MKLKKVAGALVLLLSFYNLWRIHGDYVQRSQHTVTEQPKDEFPPEPGKRHYHRCNYERVPHLAGTLETAQILRYTNWSFVRFGDMDIKLMQGEDLPYQKASDNLTRLLLQVLQSDLPNLMVGLPDTFSGCSEHEKGLVDYYMNYDTYRQWLLKHVNLDRQYFQTFITTPFYYDDYSKCLAVGKIYDTLRDVWRGKDLVILRGNNGQIYDHDVYDTAKTQKILYAPRYQACQDYDSLRNTLLKENPSSLYILAAGTVSKMLVYDLTRAGRRALDLGHLAKDYNLYAGINIRPGDFWQD